MSRVHIFVDCYTRGCVFDESNHGFWLDNLGKEFKPGSPRFNWKALELYRSTRFVIKAGNLLLCQIDSSHLLLAFEIFAANDDMYVKVPGHLDVKMAFRAMVCVPKQPELIVAAEFSPNIQVIKNYYGSDQAGAFPLKRLMRIQVAENSLQAIQVLPDREIVVSVYGSSKVLRVTSDSDSIIRVESASKEVEYDESFINNFIPLQEPDEYLALDYELNSVGRWNSLTGSFR